MIDEYKHIIIIKAICNAQDPLKKAANAVFSIQHSQTCTSTNIKILNFLDKIYCRSMYLSGVIITVSV